MDDILKSRLVRGAGRCPAGDAGIGEDDVKLSEIFGKLNKKLLAVLRHSNVGSVAARTRSQFRDCSIQGLFVTARDGDLSAFGNKKTRCGQTDAAVASGNQSFLTRELHKCLPYASPELGWPSYM